ncbi:ribonuclease HI [Shinella sp. 838]|uniref:ribonuclease H family protein n=1 Tax=Shinella sp. 838 TaxID=3038164 RepID=UPI0024157D81|nr:ribonuclease H [Shinella sp. 838]MDG4675668.1 ribonuclease HI [Shinella sp. 838]
MKNGSTQHRDLLSLMADEILRNAKRPTNRRRKGKPTGKSKAPSINDSQGIHVFADGACEPNPGPGGWAYIVIVDGEEVHSASGAAPSTTNNRMELAAVLAALEWISENAAGRPVALYSDSQYVVKGCNEWRHGWKRKGWRRGAAPVLNADLWQAIDAALVDRPQALTWCKGHSGIRGNVRADKLAGKALETLKRQDRKAA